MTKQTSIPLPSGSTIGILGGGQLGQMLSLAAARLGYKTHIFSPDAHSPACKVATVKTIGQYDDVEAAQTFALACDVVTYEFENIESDVAAAAFHSSNMPGSLKALEIAQDRLLEKTFISEDAGVPVTPFVAVDSVTDLKKAIETLGLPAVLKTRRFGYDGKGQVVVKKETDLEGALAAIGHVPAILEAFVPFKREVSVVSARTRNGQWSAYPLIENVHVGGILKRSTAPSSENNLEALTHAKKIMEAFQYVGVMAVEFFEMQDGSLMVNEIAPRVHNSGHWTQNSGCVDQFELHIRAVAGLPLGSTTPVNSVEMQNLIGREVEGWMEAAKESRTFIHLYGKSDVRDGRKMGHINRITGPA